MKAPLGNYTLLQTLIIRVESYAISWETSFITQNERSYELINLEPVDHHQAGETCQYQHPEPEKNVYFLVEDVQWQYTESVVLLQLAGRPELVESAFRQPEMKHLSQGINIFEKIFQQLLTEGLC